MIFGPDLETFRCVLKSKGLEVELVSKFFQFWIVIFGLVDYYSTHSDVFLKGLKVLCSLYDEEQDLIPSRN